jgi:large subunit ribosomal protein L6
MSRLAKYPISIPAGVTIAMDGNTMTVKGSKGELTRAFREEVVIEINGSEINLTIPKNDVFSRSIWGTTAAHIKNMITGVTTGFTKKLILEGVGFKSAVNGNMLDLALGFSHPVNLDIPSELTVTADKNIITISGIDKEKVGQFSAFVRSLKKPEPYKGKGFRYDDEVIRRKQGKKSA